MNRRGFLGGLSSLVAAPIVMRADSLMKLRGYSLQISRRWLAACDVSTDMIIARYDVLAFGELRKPPILRGVWELAPEVIARLEREMAPAIAKADHLAMHMGAPGIPWQAHADTRLRQHYSSDHSLAVLGMYGYDGAATLVIAALGIRNRVPLRPRYLWSCDNTEMGLAGSRDAATPAVHGATSDHLGEFRRACIAGVVCCIPELDQQRLRRDWPADPSGDIGSGLRARGQD